MRESISFMGSSSIGFFSDAGNSKGHINSVDTIGSCISWTGILALSCSVLSTKMALQGFLHKFLPALPGRIWNLQCVNCTTKHVYHPGYSMRSLVCCRCTLGSWRNAECTYPDTLKSSPVISPQLPWRTCGPFKHTNVPQHAG